ncbi:MAG: CRISPR-associated endonuclease Cas2 [bacterium]|nr:CRISPR-associated endonuclease Cas2 [bacterium]
MKYIISYDISNDKKREKIAKILLNHGVRMQLSYFECELTYKQLVEVSYKISKLINQGCDSIIYCPVCKRCYKDKKSYGVEYTIRELKSVII